MTDPRAEIPELPSEQSIDRLVSLLEPISRVNPNRSSTVSSTVPARGAEVLAAGPTKSPARKD